MKTIYVKTTETCNLDCDHCFTSGSKGKKVFWNPDTVMDFVKQLDETEPRDVPFHIEYHGGEPFLSKMEDLQRTAEFFRSLNRNVSLGMSTNLVFKLNLERIRFLTETLDGFSTSWDKDIRFKNLNDLMLWEKNVRLLKDDVSFVNIVLSNALLVYKPLHLVKDVILKNNIKRVRFERITISGSASINQDILPTNKEVDDWLCDLYVLCQEKQWDFEVANFTEMQTKVLDRRTNVGTYARNCEQNLYTINADGTVSGCPNDAPDKPYGTLVGGLQELQTSSARVFQILQEQTLHSTCYECSLFDKCGGGCYKVPWDETGCPTPKKLMMKIMKG